MANAATGFIQFDLVSPEKKLVSQAVGMVVVPGEEGDMGVLEGHAPVVSTLRHGVVKVYPTADEKHPDLIFVDGGFADVTANQCTILAEHAVRLPDIDQDELSAEIKKLHEDMHGATEDEALDKIRHRLDVALAKQAAISLHS
jgi:F-type H+-transporting ATPase subunit epsilon